MADKSEGTTAESVETKIEAQATLRDELEKALDPVEEASEEVQDEPDKVEEPEAAEPPAQEAESEDTAEVEEPEKTEAELNAPAHWSLEHQELFRTQAPEAQKFLLDRSKDMEAAHTKRSQEIAPLRKSIEKWQSYLDKLGATPEQAFDTLIAAEYQLRTGTEAQKREALGKLAKDYGISVEEPKANGAAQEDFLTADIQKAVAPLQQEVGTLRSTIIERDRAAQQAQADQSAEQVRQFREAKTEAGQAAHPYFDEVHDDMTRLAQAELASGKTPDITDLYDRAIWSNPTVRAKLQAAQQHAAQKQQERDKKDKVQKAKSAGVSVTGVSSAPKEQPKSLRANLEEQFART